ncbi:hypothetical protein EIP91_011093 [Steccherinum ochraceum]|uniref:Uncharacterized protein n=1 Tax=Steccherinum ochraceum TaxID=92696 RepID=A0A4R0RVU9_9APHY|nr:hypothetical protein EIP91_011093 [Steccherinum ochraceum]
MSPALLRLRSLPLRNIRPCSGRLPVRPARYSTQSSEPSKPPRAGTSHAQFYSDLIPGMVPVALLGSAVYLGLRLFQSHLAHEKYLDEAQERIGALEAEIEGLLRQQDTGVPQSSSDTSQNAPSRRWWFW